MTKRFRVARLTVSLLAVVAAGIPSMLAQTVPQDFFGMHFQGNPNSTAVLSPIVVGAVGKPQATTWMYVETARGVYSWSGLDSTVGYAKNHAVPVFYSHAYEPQWAVSDTTGCFAASSPGIFKCPAPPSDLVTSAPCQGVLTGTTTTDCQWKEFLTSVVQRYKSSGTQAGCTSGDPQCHGVIQMYEGWNEPHASLMAIADFVTLETDFLNTVRANDAGAKVCSPAFIIDPTFPSYATFMTNFFANGGPTTYDCYDFHINETTPEGQIASINQFKTILSTAGISNPLIYASEAGRWGECATTLSAADQAAYVARIELLYWANKIRRHYWYAYNGCATLTNQPTTSTLNAAGIAYGNVERWMVGSVMGALTISGSTYAAPLTKSGVTNIVAWNSGAGASYTPPAGYASYKDITGAVHPIVGGSVNLTHSPILLLPASSIPITTTGKTFSYVVTAVNSAGESGPSNQVTVTIPIP